ncbi:hypothetical protein FHR83_003540 [Actinoplanes campanulatus]|uniref:Uncharacterized protein n=1 Tax=Actinoplanes campanulatus TaxID=113559 RepID=A0A7W5AGX7_9ACTN|nr:hypothetical protein [Actinoplanes campanulatus]MBB3095870.1 hypothetical protein [Actinoplanes campanulatus]GGN12137.1 hypothetical protein GCM10010109_22520 [Actinoplanes campanulatus]GID37036.1 hypothetical protein Aca09nite_35420 [Actinoplanes campanulatus]
MSPVHRYLAVVDDGHDVKDPVTVLQVFDGSSVALQLNEDAAWVRSTLLDRIEAGETPYRLRSISPRAAARIRARRERKINFNFFLLVRDDDPTDTPAGVLREWEPSGGSGLYAETYTREGEWTSSNVRLDIERGSNIWARIVPSDASTVHQIIASWNRRWKR